MPKKLKLVKGFLTQGIKLVELVMLEEKKNRVIFPLCIGPQVQTAGGCTCTRMQEGARECSCVQKYPGAFMMNVTQPHRQGQKIDENLLKVGHLRPFKNPINVPTCRLQDNNRRTQMMALQHSTPINHVMQRLYQKKRGCMFLWEFFGPYRSCSKINFRRKCH